MSPIIKTILSIIILAIGVIMLMIAIKKSNNVALAVSIILSIVGAFLSAVSAGELLKK